MSEHGGDSVMKMSEHGGDSVSVDIDNKLAALEAPSAERSEHRIFKVYDQLRKENVGAYEPTIIAIGPYHRDKNNPAMEEHKLRYLKEFRDLSEGKSVDTFVKALRGLEERARNYYVDPPSLTKDEFVEMMLLDGCFIAHFLRKCIFKELQDISVPNDPLLRDSLTIHIKRDLMLMENQLPFFVLGDLIDMTMKSPYLLKKTKTTHPLDITDLVHKCFSTLLPRAAKTIHPADNIRDRAQNGYFCAWLPRAAYDSKPCPPVSTNSIDHILGLMHTIWCSSFSSVVSQANKKKIEEWDFIKCTTELREAGVQFRKSSNPKISLFDIKFEGGVIEIPPLIIFDFSEHIFRNLIAYEQHFPMDQPRFVSDYLAFMDCLINSAKDVEKLRHKEIIMNCVGDDETISTMFNKLGKQGFLGKNNSYSPVFKKLKKHCKNRPKLWWANLRGKYCNTPWSTISVIAASLLLVFTLIQTVFSVLSYF